MASRNGPPDDRPNIGSAPFLEGLQALEGEEMPADQDSVLDPDEIEERRVPTQTEFDRLDPDGRVADDADEIEGLGGGVGGALREGETDDPEVAAEEGLSWVPPIDPPVVATPWEDDPVVAAGTGVSALDESYDESPGVLNTEEGDLNERIREALRADSATSRLADVLVIAVVGKTAIIRGVVDDDDDGDAIVAVVERVPGIDDVLDETSIRGSTRAREEERTVSSAVSFGRPSVASSQVMSGSERNQVRWRLENARLRWASSWIAASRVSSPSRTAQASR